MQRSMVFALAFALLCAPQLASALENDLAPGCASGTCPDSGSDETVLIQTNIQEHRHQAKVNRTQLPDLSNLTDAITGIVDTVADTATDAIVDLAKTVKKDLESMKEKLASITKKVNDTEEVVKSGVATILSEAFGLTFEGISVGEKEAEETIRVITEADSVWSSVVQALQALSTVIDSGLGLVGSPADDLEKQVDAAMQGVLSSAEGVLGSLETVEATLENLTSDATSQASEAANKRSTALLQAKLDPTAVLDTLNAAVAEFSDQSIAVASSINGVIGNLTSQIPDIVKDIIGTDDMTKVTKALGDVQTAVTDLTSEITSLSNVLGGITEVTAAAADALSSKSGAGGQPLARWGLGAAAAAALAVAMV